MRVYCYDPGPLRPISIVINSDDSIDVLIERNISSLVKRDKAHNSKEFRVTTELKVQKFTSQTCDD